VEGRASPPLLPPPQREREGEKWRESEGEVGKLREGEKPHASLLAGGKRPAG
jgi:hypothetical protein